MDNNKLTYLIKYLLAERPEISADIPQSADEKFRLYRSLVNTRPAMKADSEYLAAEEDFLKKMTAEKGITDISQLVPYEKNIYLWQGDITTLRCGAIVNAANSGMTGCWHPCHSWPIVSGHLTDDHCRLLKSCYSSCLELAEQNGIKSIAFCCISTGVFGFPQKEAAEIAVSTVREFVKSHDIEVIFNVFSDRDFEIYRKLL